MNLLCPMGLPPDSIDGIEAILVSYYRCSSEEECANPIPPAEYSTIRSGISIGADKLPGIRTGCQSTFSSERSSRSGISLAGNENMIAFGPIPSRRLGRSLGINNIPYKLCNYSCVYCQLGRTLKMQSNRSAFYNPQQVFEEVRQQLFKVKEEGETVDYLTFVPDGEPTLDLNLGVEIELLRQLRIPIAVITNASLISDADVRKDLCKADWVSLKIDSVQEDVWRKVDRPHGLLDLKEILNGMLLFASEFKGTLVTETMLVKGLNDNEATALGITDFLLRLKPSCSYLLIPTRPPAEDWVEPPEEETVVGLFQIFQARVPKVECLIGFEGTRFASAGDAEQDLLNITAVHPMREDAVKEFLRLAGASWQLVDRLMETKRLRKVEWQGKRFYIKTFEKGRSDSVT